jgi:hypothetical protein
MSIYQVTLDMVKNEGYRSLFKGMTSPILGQTPYNTVCFGVTHFFKECLGVFELKEQTKSFLAGCSAGACALTVYVPIELLKIKAQKNKIENINYREQINRIIRKQGY